MIIKNSGEASSTLFSRARRLFLPPRSSRNQASQTSIVDDRAAVPDTLLLREQLEAMMKHHLTSSLHKVRTREKTRASSSFPNPLNGINHGRRIPASHRIATIPFVLIELRQV